jgi:hypothetical protein
MSYAVPKASKKPVFFFVISYLCRCIAINCTVFDFKLSPCSQYCMLSSG